MIPVFDLQEVFLETGVSGETAERLARAVGDLPRLRVLQLLEDAARLARGLHGIVAQAGDYVAAIDELDAVLSVEPRDLEEWRTGGAFGIVQPVARA